MDIILHQLMLYVDSHPEEGTYKTLANLMIEHIDELAGMTIYDMADCFFVSTATLSRFCRMLGYNNFSHFKDKLQAPYGFQVDYTPEYLSGTYEQSLAYLQNQTLECLQNMRRHLSGQTLEEIARLIHDYQNVYIAGYMGYEFLFMYLQQKLGLFHKFIHVTPASSTPANRKNDYGPTDLVIMISLRGSPFTQKTLVSTLIQNNVPRILISQNTNAYYKEHYDRFFVIGGTPDNNLGMISLQFFIDELILTYYHLYKSELIL